ncbi:MAG TPA: putative ABC transporter permease, partial [Clostridia bacterium]
LIVLLVRKKRKWYVSFLLGGVVAAFFEYLLHELEYIFTGNVSWDYTYVFLYIPSIATRGKTAGTSIPHMFIWGALGLFLERIVYPLVSKVIEKIPPLQGKMVFNALAVFLAFDMALTGAVFLRQGERLKGNEPVTMVGEWIDKNYPDEYIYEIFPDKKPEEEKS